MNGALRARLVAAGTAGTLAVASTLVAWHEGDGPTQTVNGVKYHIAYRDVAGIWTICHGLTGKGIRAGVVMSEIECELAEKSRLEEYQAGVLRLIPRYPTFNKWRQAALLSYSWNLGLGALEGSTMRRLFNSGYDTAACYELAKWNKARVRGVLTVLRGLVTRRADETELCLAKEII